MGGRRTVEGGPACEHCGRTTWDVGFITDGEPVETPIVGIAFVDIHAAPMARCASCGWSQRLDD